MKNKIALEDVFLEFIKCLRVSEDKIWNEEYCDKFERIIKNPDLANSIHMNGITLTELTGETCFGFTMWISFEDE